MKSSVPYVVRSHPNVHVVANDNKSYFLCLDKVQNRGDCKSGTVFLIPEIKDVAPSIIVPRDIVAVAFMTSVLSAKKTVSAIFSRFSKKLQFPLFSILC